MTPESRLLQSIRLLSTGPVRLFRNNTAMGWAGKIVTRGPNTITLLDPYPLHAGLCDGSSDLIGWTVRNGVAVFTAIEVKTPGGRVTEEQRRFIETVQAAGGIAGVCRSTADAQELLR